MHLIARALQGGHHGIQHSFDELHCSSSSSRRRRRRRRRRRGLAG